MNYEIYGEQSRIIGVYEYALLRNRLAEHHLADHYVKGTVRSLYFSSDFDAVTGNWTNDKKNTDTFSINIFNGDISHMTLDKHSYREGMTCRGHTYLTYEQCRRIMEGDIEWMADSPQMLLHDLYLQMTINRLKPEVMAEYRRRVYTLGSRENLVFDTAIHCACMPELDEAVPKLLASDDLPMVSRLDAGQVMMTCRRRLRFMDSLAAAN